MDALLCCEVCGNERDPAVKACPFCGAEAEVRVECKGLQHKVINLERGMPLVDEALARLAGELELARRQRCRVLTLIHGYGSSGRGGAIRHEVRAQLEFFKTRGRINDLLPGEEFSSRTGIGRQFLRRFPFLQRHNDLNRSNPGITLVIL
jgi:hypothetical protein